MSESEAFEPIDGDDTDLTERICRHDSEALAELMRRRENLLKGFVRSLCSDRLLSVVEVDDLYQEISAAAISSLATAPLDQYTPMQWLQQIARRRVVDAHRFHFEAQRRDAGRQSSLQAGADDEKGGLEALLAASFTTASAAFSRDIRMIRLQEAIDELGDEARQAVMMRYSRGLPSKDIAEQLGKTDAAVRVLLSRSLRQLEKKLSDVRPTR
ncbi:MULTISPECIES: RNA polymerase sigma factor [Crateriforma]|uniref:RNA polymerase sigma factor n=1 Tax=Crateriforma conspicua TaxID=2527996 RepID=A0A5C6FVC4_9PLAN|nr:MULTISPECIES: sigma-70 family RNA polymerase sigma factor [Crateriforma]TWU66266.1 RNA polymerase sigma factor [Crateriforma conspicua]